MENFVYKSPTKIIFGKDTELEVGKETKKFASKILFHYVKLREKDISNILRLSLK